MNFRAVDAAVCLSPGDQVRTLQAQYAAAYPPLITFAEAATIARFAVGTVHNWSSAGLLDACRVGPPGRAARLVRDEFVRLFATGALTPGGAAGGGRRNAHAAAAGPRGTDYELADPHHPTDAANADDAGAAHDDHAAPRARRRGGRPPA